MERSPSDSYSLTLRVKLSTRAGTLGEVTTAIGRAGGFDIFCLHDESDCSDPHFNSLLLVSVSPSRSPRVSKGLSAKFFAIQPSLTVSLLLVSARRL
ncbi:MAG TPA: hypothetical protein VGN90_17335 [Pyrinomonadaceae bacterium]|jgi:hypothetical protein|nr:hypothetical protein [Pyrinomonadaceae bacterium]